MQRDEHLTQLRADGHRMAELADGDLDAMVPACPGWSLADLVRHTGFVHRWQTAVVRDDPDAFPDRATWRHPPAEGQSMGAWFRAGVDEAVTTFASVDPSERRWTWAGSGDVAWYARRAAQETLVHRIDAERAVGAAPDPVGPAVAVDGVDEMCDVFLVGAGKAVGGSGETIHLHATDAEGEWLLTMLDDRVEVARGHAKGDAAVRGAAVDLLLVVWGRPPLFPVETFGDESLVTRFQAAVAI